MPPQTRDDRAAAGPEPGDGADWNTAFDTLFRNCRAGLFRFLLQRLRSREDAEDALMQTFFKAWRARDGFRGATSETSWLYGIAAHVAVDLLRARRRRPTESGIDLTGRDTLYDQESDDGDPADTLMAAERRAEIRDAIRRLSADQRRLLELYYFEECPYAEISTRLGIPYTQVRGRLSRIRRLIEQDLVSRKAWRPVNRQSSSVV